MSGLTMKQITLAVMVLLALNHVVVRFFNVGPLTPALSFLVGFAAARAMLAGRQVLQRRRAVSEQWTEDRL